MSIRSKSERKEQLINRQFITQMIERRKIIITNNKFYREKLVQLIRLHKGTSDIITHYTQGIHIRGDHA